LTPPLASSDAFVYKLDASGAIMWSRQFGTSDHDSGGAAVVDSQGNVYIAGGTDGALSGTNMGSSDAYVRKLDPSGTTLWTKQFGTSMSEAGTALVVDASNNVYVVGVTDGAFQGSNAGLNDIYVRKLDPSGTTLSSRQVGTKVDDLAEGAAIDSSGNLYVVGSKGQFFSSDTADAFVLFMAAEGF